MTKLQGESQCHNSGACSPLSSASPAQAFVRYHSDDGPHAKMVSGFNKTTVFHFSASHVGKGRKYGVGLSLKAFGKVSLTHICLSLTATVRKQFLRSWRSTARPPPFPTEERWLRLTENGDKNSQFWKDRSGCVCFLGLS